MLGWTSGDQRRSELTGPMRGDVSLKELDEKSLVWISLLETKTTTKGETPRLVLKGHAAQALVHWIEVGEIEDAPPLLRPISKADQILKRRLSLNAAYLIVTQRLKRQVYPKVLSHRTGCSPSY